MNTMTVEDQVERALASENPVRYVMDLYEMGITNPCFTGKRMDMAFFCAEVCDRVYAVLYNEEIKRRTMFPYE